MGIAAGMKDLTREIRSSHKDRGRSIKEMRQGAKRMRREVQDMVRDFHHSRVEASAELKGELAQDKATRESEVTQMRAGFRQDQAVLKAELKQASAAWQQLASAKGKNRRKGD